MYKNREKSTEEVMHILCFHSFIKFYGSTRCKNIRTLGGIYVCENVNGIQKFDCHAFFCNFLYLVVGVICNLIWFDLPLSIYYRAKPLMLTHVSKNVWYRYLNYFRLYIGGARIGLLHFT